MHRLVAVWLLLFPMPLFAAPKPNIVVILADDLGYGDVRYLNPAGKIPTPHIDRFAAKGVAFTDAHSASSVCSPTRYGLLTGRYCWRTQLTSGVLGGYSDRLIETGRETIASVLKKQGYRTACFGKWHVGMDWTKKDGTTLRSRGNAAIDYVDQWNVDYTKRIANGPGSVGFDAFFGIAASLDMPPFAFIENDAPTEIPTVDKTWVRTGPAAKSFEAIDVLPTLTKKATEYIAARAKEPTPFFLYLPLASPHTPILPSKEWQGKSGLNAYADFTMQTDAAIGEVLDTLQKQGIADNTLVIITSDNGCSPQAKFPELKMKGHNPSHIFRGTKADIYEGGHRVPFLVRWPGHAKPGVKSDRLVCLNDIFRTCAEVAETTRADDAGEDSFSFLSEIGGAKSDIGHRTDVVHHSVDGSFAIRDDKWKLCLCPGSGGWSTPRPRRDDSDKLPPVQLFDMAIDPSETTNRAVQFPEVVERLRKRLQSHVDRGRSTPGTDRKNATEVNVERAGQAAQKLIPK